MPYGGRDMHRTQVYFEEATFERIKQRANRLGVSVSAYIRAALNRELAEPEGGFAPDFSEFAGIWRDRDDIDLQSLRKKAWK